MTSVVHEDSLYHFYQQNVFDLARSIIIKNSLVAEAMNKELREEALRRRDLRFQVDESDPTTWRYYRHLAGEYHPADEIMEVISLDTLKPIVLSKENVRIHRATWRGYAQGSELYQQLVKKYPKQELLIRGIINPIDKQVAIDAREYEILYFQSDLIDGNEYYLISELQTEIRNYLSHWDTAAYNITEEYYEPLRMAILYMFIPSFILNIRLKYANTIYANRYHIWNFLGSRLGLDRYRSYLTTEQSMWLYRNINWILENVGKQETFEELIENIMSKRLLPLSGYHLEKQYGDVLDLKGDVLAVREQKNLPQLDWDSKDDRVALSKIFYKETTLAPLNALREDEGLQEDFLSTAQTRWSYGLRDHLNTKVLESHVENFSQQEKFPFDDTLLNYWIFTAFTGKYQTIITTDNPSSADVITMNPREAWIVFFYSFWRATYEESIDNTGLIGHIFPKDIFFPVMPENEYFIKKLDNRLDYTLYLRFIREIYPTLTNIYSTEEFYRFASDIHQFKYRLYNLSGLIDDGLVHGEIEHLTEYLKADHSLPMVDEEISYFTFFKDRGWKITELTKDQYLSMALDIFMKITGKDLNDSNSIENVQTNMVRLMEKLTSYHVQFTKTIKGVDMIVLDLPVLRLGYIRREESHLFRFLRLSMDVQKIDTFEEVTKNFDVMLLEDGDTEVFVHETHTLVNEVPLEFALGSKDTLKKYIPFTPPEFTVREEWEDITDSVFIHNGSIFGLDAKDHYFNTISLSVFRDVEEIDILPHLYPDYHPTSYDWASFFERYPSKTKADVVISETSKMLDKHGRILSTERYDVRYDLNTGRDLVTTLDGFRWYKGSYPTFRYPLQGTQTEGGFNWGDEIKLTSFELSIFDPTLPGFVWKPISVDKFDEKVNITYFAVGKLNGFVWRT